MEVKSDQLIVMLPPNVFVITKRIMTERLIKHNLISKIKIQQSHYTLYRFKTEKTKNQIRLVTNKLWNLKKYNQNVRSLHILLTFFKS